MSQRGEKYARNMERRTGSLEKRAGRIEDIQEKNDQKLNEQGRSIKGIEADLKYAFALYDFEKRLRRQGVTDMERANRRRQREIERVMGRQRVAVVIAMALAAIAMIVAFKALGTAWAAGSETQAGTMAATMPTAVAKVDQLDTDMVVGNEPWEFVAAYQETEDPQEAEKIEEALLAQGYFSVAVPMCYEYQDYMRTYCTAYGCPYPLALAVAEVESNFDMNAIGEAGEIGIMQLNPGPDGAYLQELQEATGIDPTTPYGNIAAGCYKLGKWLEEYGDTAKALMAYNMGRYGAESAWAEGINCTEYTEKVLAAMERWECIVNK